MASDGEATKSLISTTLDLPPSCIEFSPIHPELFVVGTYNLEKQETDNDDEWEDVDGPAQTATAKKPQERNGSLILFKLENDELQNCQTASHPSAILDLHFSPFQPSIFAIASSTGSVSLYEIKHGDTSEVVLLNTFQLFPKTTLVLSLAWHPSHGQLLGVTLSTSHAALISLSPDFSAAEVVRQDLNNHSDLEAWTLAFAPPQPQSPTMPQALYTGGDDSKLRVLAFPSIASIRHTLEEIQSASAGGAQGLRGHEAGVTAILPLPLGTVAGKDILLTGSYDDHVRVYAVHDYRPGQSRNPKILAENNLGGGVWRLKLMNLTANHKPKPTDPVTFIVLASCMHAGTRILRVTGSLEGEWSIEVLARFEEHKSMNYGSDVQPLRKRDWKGLHPEADAEAKLDEGKDWTIVSTSFYDRLLCVWKVAHV